MEERNAVISQSLTTIVFRKAHATCSGDSCNLLQALAEAQAQQRTTPADHLPCKLDLILLTAEDVHVRLTQLSLRE